MVFPSHPARLSADIGGTFTDIVLDAGGRRFTTKLLTTPRAPEAAVVNGAVAMLAEAGLGFADLAVFVHGTTLATNAIIERRGAKVALVATAGFRDVIEIADEGRYDQYDLFIDKPKHLVPRELRFTVPERLDVHGGVRLALDEAAMAAIARDLAGRDIEAVAVAFLHAYANPAHEERARAILAAHAPHLRVSLSSEVCPEAREYERTSTTICNAYVQPLMAGYLERLEAVFAAKGSRAPIRLMTSGGHLVTLEAAARFPIRLVESGPAGGAILAAGIAAARDEKKVLSFDMGGTTAKVCLISDATPLTARIFEIDRAHRFRKGSGLPVRIPAIEMVEIGAGGGSIAKIDALRQIEVGPQSAGSEPGPACYGRGGERPTVTDADLVIGKIDVARFAGGAIQLNPQAAREAVETHIGAPLGLDTFAAALGVAAVVDENMANAARVHAVERGRAIGEHTMIAFGGAAPLHACRVAEKLGISRIVVPEGAGVGSAIGFLEAPAAYELVRSRYMRLDRFDVASADAHLATMAGEARTLAAAAAPPGAAFAEKRTAFMRYAGQGHEIAVALPGRPLQARDDALLRAAFEAEYRALFARHIPGAIIEIMSWQIVVAAPVAPLEKLAPAPPQPGPKPIGEAMLHTEAGPLAALVYDRAAFVPGGWISGPAMVVEAGTSTIVTPGFDLAMDSGRALVLTRKEGRA